MSPHDAGLLYVLLPLFVLWAGLYLGRLIAAARGKVRCEGTLTHPLAGRLAGLRPSWAQRLRPWVQGLRLPCLALLGVALLRPQEVRPGPKIWARGVDVLLAVDTSRSMEALDLDADRPIAQRRTRLRVVQDVLKSFLAQRPNDQLGLVVFGSDAFTQCPLTLDHDMLGGLLERLQPGMAGDTTAIGDGMAVGLNRLRRSTARSKIMILLTDGSNNAGQLSPRRAADLARSLGIKVYTVGAGSRGAAPILRDTLFGKQVAYMDADLDEKTLADIAQTTGGRFFRAEDSGALAQTYRDIDALEKSPLARPAPFAREERFAPFVLGALACLVLECVLLRTRLRLLP